MTSLMGWAVKVAANENCWCAPPIIDADRPTNTYWPDRGDSPQSAVNLDSPPVSTQSLQPGAGPASFIGGQDRRPRAGLEFLWRGRNPLPPHQQGGPWARAVSSPTGFVEESRPPKVFPLFPTLRMGARPPCSPCVRPCLLQHECTKTFTLR